MILAASLALALGAPAGAAEVAVSADGHAYNPVWSPNGEWLAFELNQFEGNVDLYVVKVQNGNPVGSPTKVAVPGASSSFAAGGTMAAGAVWHPPNMLIFEGSTAGGSNRLYYWAPGGQKASQLLTTTQVGGDLTWPCVSPDGKTIAFVSDASGNGDIYAWDRNSNAVTRSINSAFTEMAPRFSPAGKLLAYSRKNQGGEDLFVLEGTTSVPRIGGNGDQTRPVWADDSAVVFFTNERGDDHWDIAVSKAAGDKKIIAKDVRLPLRSTPALSVDRRWVAYGTNVAEKASRIYLTAIDGSRTIEVDTGMVAAGEPSLSVVGDKIFLAYTALPSNSATWRQLHVMDVTAKLR